MSTNDEYYHNKGEQDATNGTYNPPNGIMQDLITWSSSGMGENNEENDAYDSGYFHTKGQIDRNEGRYNPPSGREAREAYDSGYD